MDKRLEAYDLLIKESLHRIEALEAELDTLKRANREPIAVIGMGCRFPGADSPLEYWQLLRDGRDAIIEVPKDRWDIDAYYDPDLTRRGR